MANGYETRNYEVKKANTPSQPVKKQTVRYGLPVGSKAKLGDDNKPIFVSDRETNRRNGMIIGNKTNPVEIKKGSVEEKETSSLPAEIESAAGESENPLHALLNVNADPAPCEAAGNKSIVRSAKEVVGLFTTRRVKTVSMPGEENTRHKIPVFSILTVILVCILFMFVIIDYVQIFENNASISSIKSEIAENNEEIKRLTTEIDGRSDVISLSEEAKNRLGMIGAENQKSMYIDVSEEEKIEAFENTGKNYTGLGMIMNAIRESAVSMIDMFTEQ